MSGGCDRQLSHPPSILPDKPMKTATTRSVFACQECGNQSTKWLGRCPECGNWNTYVEEQVRAQPVHSGKSASRALASGARPCRSRRCSSRKPIACA